MRGSALMAKSIFVLNGPNLNLLGQRQPEVYGRNTLADVEALCRARAERYGFDLTFRQSNHEGDVVDWLQEARQEAAGVIINPGAFTHTSIAILDAIIATELPVIEVHISNIHAREEFRRHSYVSTVAKAVLCGFGIEGYGLAIDGLAALLGVKAQAA
jgi:3-dehydroquinate dehydratase II